MIDTDKFEGHTLHTTTLHMDEADSNGSREMRLSDGGIVGWLIMDNYPKADINAKLIAAAPELLAEVKRLRGLSNALWDHICLIGGDMSDATDIWNEWSEEE